MSSSLTFQELKILGAYEIESTSSMDDRGSFTRLWCEKEFEKKNLSFSLSQLSLSWNPEKGTLRGLHYQSFPYEEIKIVTCLQGKIYDVLVDLRSSSPTFQQWEAVELSPYKKVYIPAGVAHGFQTLEANTQVLYQISGSYEASAAQTLRWDDPTLQISWPLPISRMSEKDRNGTSLKNHYF